MQRLADRHEYGTQGFAAFRLNVQLSHEYSDKLAKAAGKFRNQVVGSAFESWKQYAQHNKMLQSRLATAVGALRNRELRAAFCGWREAAAVRKGHKQKVNPEPLICLSWCCKCKVKLCRRWGGSQAALAYSHVMVSAQLHTCQHAHNAGNHTCNWLCLFMVQTLILLTSSTIERNIRFVGQSGTLVNFAQLRLQCQCPGLSLSSIQLT